MLNPLLVKFLRLSKPILSRTIYKPGKPATILLGPARGLKYRIFPDYGLSMIYGGWEPEIHDVMVRHVGAGGVAYDLGANFGIYSMFLAKLVGPSGTVYAFEPVGDIMRQLQDNIAMNNLQNVEFVSRACADQSGSTEFRIGNHSGSGHLDSADSCHRDAGPSIQVSTVSLDDFVANGAKPPTFIKVDVEGAEGLVFSGAARVLKEHRPTIAVEVHSEEQSRIVGRALSNASYSAFRVRPGLPKIDGLSNGFLYESGSAAYILCIPD